MGKKREVDDRFKKIGTVSFTAISKTNDFIGHLDQGRVTATRCLDCGQAFFPPRADCAACLTSNMEWFDINSSGKLVTYSKLEFAPVGFEGDLPYAIAVVDFGDFKVFGRIAGDVPEEDIKAGLEMTVAANTLPSGQLNYVFHKA